MPLLYKSENRGQNATVALESSNVRTRSRYWTRRDGDAAEPEEMGGIKYQIKRRAQLGGRDDLRLREWGANAGRASSSGRVRSGVVRW